MPESSFVVAQEPIAKKQNQFKETLKRLSRNKSATIGMIIFLIIVLMAIF